MNLLHSTQPTIVSFHLDRDGVSPSSNTSLRGDFENLTTTREAGRSSTFGRPPHIFNFADGDVVGGICWDTRTYHQLEHDNLLLHVLLYRSGKKCKYQEGFTLHSSRYPPEEREREWKCNDYWTTQV